MQRPDQISRFRVMFGRLQAIALDPSESLYLIQVVGEEIAMKRASEFDELRWFKSRASTSGNGCVEIAHLPDGGVAVRHSRKPDAEVIRYTAYEWDCFLDGAKKGEFDRPAASDG